MSRIGKKAIAVPSGITAAVEGQTVKIKGPKGALQVALHDDVEVKLDKGQIKVDPRSETKRARSQWGTSRTLINNLITGVTKGFEERLEINEGRSGCRRDPRLSSAGAVQGQGHQVRRRAHLPQGRQEEVTEPHDDQDERQDRAAARPRSE